MTIKYNATQFSLVSGLRNAGKTIEEIAEATGIPRSSVWHLLKHPPGTHIQSSGPTKVVVHDHLNDRTSTIKGDGLDILVGLARLFPWLDIQPHENINDVIEDINHQQFYEAELVPTVMKNERDDLVALATEGIDDNNINKTYFIAEALFHVLGGKNSEWQPQEVDGHWFLHNKSTGQIIDPTQDESLVDHTKAQDREFVSEKPSREAQKIIDHIHAHKATKGLQKTLTSALGLVGAMALSGGPGPTVTHEPPEVQAIKWTPAGLHPTLIPIAHLESSFGVNTQHIPSPKGDYDTAFGAVGLKPMTAHEEYLRSPTLQAKYGDLKDPVEFTAKMKSDPQFYNLLATTHFLRLMKQHGTPHKAAFAWRYGTTAASLATPEEIEAAPYVQQYKTLSAAAGITK